MQVKAVFIPIGSLEKMMQTELRAKFGDDRINEINSEFRCIASLYTGVKDKKAPSHSLLDIYAQGRQEAFADVVTVNTAKIIGLKEEQEKLAAQIDRDTQRYKEIDIRIELLQKVTDGANRAVNETAELRKGLVV